MQLCGSCRGGGVVPGNIHISSPTQDMGTGSREKATRLDPRQDAGVGGETRGVHSEQPGDIYSFSAARDLGFFHKCRRATSELQPGERAHVVTWSGHEAPHSGPGPANQQLLLPGHLGGFSASWLGGWCQPCLSQQEGRSDNCCGRRSVQPASLSRNDRLRLTAVPLSFCH